MTIETAIAMNRFGLGVRPGQSLPGKPKNWLLDQFGRYNPRPPIIAQLPGRGELVEALAELRANAKVEREKRKAASAMENANADVGEAQFNNYRKAVRDNYSEAVSARLQSAVTSEADFAERLVHFWANHFAVSIDKITVVGLAGNFEFEAIRPNIFGKFGTLLSAAVHHPAMLLYLDQAQSIGPDSPLASRVRERRNKEIGLNENLAREILELHTLGVGGGYSQTDVTEFARALTGTTFAGLNGGPVARLIGPDFVAGETVFIDAIHQPGTRRVLGQSYAQTGKGQAAAILSDIAVHPATAKHIATKLARHFVADNPPATLVAKLEANFRKTGGDLASLYRTLIEAPESWVPHPPKFKSPWEWTVSALRGLNVAEIPGRAQAAAGLFNQMGQPIWRPGSPKGFGDMTADWAGPASLMRRIETAGRFARLAAGRIDARALAATILPGSLSPATAQHIARAESPEQGLALLLVAPEFLRR
jgi:uncharacterized protein (DUF1800 family)